MSGIAELLANLGYVVSGSDEKRSAVTDRLQTLGIRVAHRPRFAPRRRRRGRRRFDGGRSGERRGARSDAPADSGDSARRDARGADAASLQHRGGRRPRQDDDDVDDRGRARAGGARSDGRHRRPGERLRQQRAAGAGRADGRRGGRKRSIVSEIVSDDCGDDEHRPRASRKLRRLRRPAAGVRRLRQQGAVLRRSHRVRRRPEPDRRPAADDEARDHVWSRRGRRRDGDRRRAGSARPRRPP